MKTYEQALGRLTAYCAASEHCVSEVESKLDTWEVDETDRQRIIDYLLTNNYIDHTRYCRAFVNDRLRYSHYGRVKLRLLLRQKHLPSDSVDEALEQIDDDMYNAVLTDLLRNKLRSTRAENGYQLRAKLFRYAQSRGFEYDEINEALEQLLTPDD